MSADKRECQMCGGSGKVIVKKDAHGLATKHGPCPGCDKPTVHLVRTETTRRQHRAHCDCGWVGPWGSLDGAEDSGHVHRQLQAVVDAASVLSALKSEVEATR